MAGLFITIESWLLVKTTQRTRGQILSFYMVDFYAAQALGQFLLSIGDPKGVIPFITAALLVFLICSPFSYDAKPPRHILKNLLL